MYDGRPSRFAVHLFANRKGVFQTPHHFLAPVSPPFRRVSFSFRGCQERLAATAAQSAASFSGVAGVSVGGWFGTTTGWHQFSCCWSISVARFLPSVWSGSNSGSVHSVQDLPQNSQCVRLVLETQSGQAHRAVPVMSRVNGVHWTDPSTSPSIFTM